MVPSKKICSLGSEGTFLKMFPVMSLATEHFDPWRASSEGFLLP